MVGHTRNYSRSHANWCLRCHSRFKGRKNAKFCSDACRLQNWKDKQQATINILLKLVLKELKFANGVGVEDCGVDEGLIARLKLMVGLSVETGLNRLEKSLNYSGLFWDEWSRKYLWRIVRVRQVKIGKVLM